ncbi:MAG TPA: cell envelope integrity protein CreD, partial [Flavobacteriaceae bacterium]|nr:cell envelope integrity protein CreD [Flavobacteriaceae bacterium]
MEQKKNKFSNWMRNSITARMLVVGVLIMVLLIPLSFVKDLITERSYRQKEVVNEINSKWGNEVVLSGPILKVPYTIEKEEKTYDKKKESYFTTTKEISKFAYFLPDKLNIDSKVETKPLNRSIYKSVVYNSDIEVSGEFPIIDFSSEAVKPKTIEWEKASVIVQTSNLKGIRNTLEVQLGNQKLTMNPKYDTNSLNTIQSEAIVGITETVKSPTPFSF